MTSGNPWLNRLLLAIALLGGGYGVLQHYILPKPAPAPPKQSHGPALQDAPIEPFSGKDFESYQTIKRMHVTGDYDGALKLAQQILAAGEGEATFREWLSRQLPYLLTASAWLKIHSGDCDDALKLLYASIQISTIPEARKGLGACLHQLHNWPEAASWLAGYILEKPTDVDSRILYADALESLGRYDEAVSALEGALGSQELVAEKREGVLTRLQAMRVKSREGSRQRSEYSRRFFVSYREDEHDRFIAGVFETLEAALDEFIEVTGIPAPEAPVEVVLYRRAAFHDAIPGGPAWSEGVFDGRIRVPLSAEMANSGNDLLATILRHELSHALLARRSNGRRWPPWFDEGLAQYLSCRGRACDGFSFGATPGTFSDPKFLNDPFVTLSAIDAGRAYQHSLYMLRMMIKQKSEDALRTISRELPDKGTIDSDQIATSAGYHGFSDWTDQAQNLWRQKAK